MSNDTLSLWAFGALAAVIVWTFRWMHVSDLRAMTPEERAASEVARLAKQARREHDRMRFVMRATIVAKELTTLLVVWAVARKAPDDFYLLVFLMGVLAYRKHRQDVARREYEGKKGTFPSETAAILEKAYDVSEFAGFSVDVVLLIALVVIAIR